VAFKQGQIPRIAIAAAASGVGKTTVAAGLMAALHRQGSIVQPFKCGPDYIDPSYHERAAQRVCRNLDAWMLEDRQLTDGFSRACRDVDVAIIEGVMGLFDGSNWHDEHASTAQIVKLLGVPTLLVIDISGAARSAAAVVLGCQHFDPAVAIRGVILNFAGSEGHANGCAEAITSMTGLPVLGWLPRDPTLQIPERHLGLVPGGENVDSNPLIGKIADAIAARFDLPEIMRIARSAGELPGFTAPLPAKHSRPSRGPVLAVARDEAFCFYYPENLELLAEAGAQIEYFSPLRGEAPGQHAAGVYLGGGYPELHAPQLAGNAALWDALGALRMCNAPIYAECGGFMALTQGLIDRDGHRWPMAGLIPGITRMTDKIAALGYRNATAARCNILSDAGEVLRGHEFRYSTWETDAPIAASQAWQLGGSRMEAPPDAAGFASGNLLASYVHIHFAQRAEIADRFVEKLAAVRRE
jgi:cobyrinic acid a,c-diamide synthase